MGKAINTDTKVTDQPNRQKIRERRLEILQVNKYK